MDPHAHKTTCGCLSHFGIYCLRTRKKHISTKNFLINRCTVVRTTFFVLLITTRSAMITHAFSRGTSALSKVPRTYKSWNQLFRVGKNSARSLTTHDTTLSQKRVDGSTSLGRNQQTTPSTSPQPTAHANPRPRPTPVASSASPLPPKPSVLSTPDGSEALESYALDHSSPYTDAAKIKIDVPKKGLEMRMGLWSLDVIGRRQNRWKKFGQVVGGGSVSTPVGLGDGIRAYGQESADLVSEHPLKPYDDVANSVKRENVSEASMPRREWG